nr:E2 [Columba livia papillomavirus 1]
MKASTMENARMVLALQALQEREAELLEKDHHTLAEILDYWGTVRRTQTLLAAAAKQGIKRVGGTKVPPASVTEHEAKDAIMMTILLDSLAQSPYARLQWELGDMSPQLYRQRPEGLKRGPRRVLVRYCGDPDTDTEYPLWETVLLFDPGSRQWTESHCGADNVGIWQDIDGRRHYTLLWRDDGRKQCLGPSITWELLSQSATGDQLQRPFSSSLGSPSPPKLSFYDRPDAAAEQPRTSTPKQRAPKRKATRSGGRGVTKEPAKKRRPRTKGTADTIDGVAPESVGAAHTSAPRSGLSRLQRLISDARDPPGIVFEGRTSQLKTIRHRLRGCAGGYSRVSSTWHWIGESEENSKIIVLFETEDQRSQFENTFRVSNSGVRAFHVALKGL